MILFTILFLLIATIVSYQMTKHNSSKPLIRIPRKVSFIIPFVYLMVIVLATIVLYVVPLNKNVEFQPVDSVELKKFSTDFDHLYSRESDKVDSTYLVKEWVQEVSDDEFYLKPRTIGQMPVLVIIERIPETSNRIESFLYEGKLVMDGFVAQGYGDEVEVNPQGNVLTVSSKGAQSYTLGYFQHDGVMTQFTRKSKDNQGHYSSEWSPILYLKIPESINVTIDESIADQVNER
jgi:hypothetical protein